MFSGKTSYLLAFERRLMIANKSIMLVKWSGDTRHNKRLIQSHDGVISSSETVINMELLGDISASDIAQVDAILIDEGQFFPDLAEFCARWGKEKIIVISGLSGDYMQKPFSSISNVISLADEIIHTKSICMKCSADASFTKRLTASTQQTLVGSSETYQPRCGKCFNKE